MAKVLTVAPADLTEISKRANGKFPADRVVEIIRYGGNVTGHGSQVMPIWGRVFSSEGGSGKVGNAYSQGHRRTKALSRDDSEEVASLAYPLH